MRLPRTPLESLLLHLFPPERKRTPNEVERLEILISNSPETAWIRKEKGGYVEKLVLGNVAQMPSNLQRDYNEPQNNSMIFMNQRQYAPSNTVWNLSRIKELWICGNVSGSLFQAGGIGQLQPLKGLALCNVSTIPNGIGLLFNLTTIRLENCFDIDERCIHEMRQVRNIFIIYDVGWRKDSSFSEHRLVSLKPFHSFQNLQTICFDRMPKKKIFEFFARPWTGSSILRTVVVEDCELNEDDYSRIQSGLPPSLEVFGWIYDNIRDLYPLVKHGLPKGIRGLSLVGNAINFACTNQEEFLFRLLKDHPMLGCVRGVAPKMITPRIFYQMLYNYRVRPLLEDVWNEGVHVAVWPLLFEQASSHACSGNPGTALLVKAVFEWRGHLWHQFDLVERQLSAKSASIWMTFIYTVLREHPAIISMNTSGLVEAIEGKKGATS